jgi:hypothetical protein
MWQGGCDCSVSEETLQNGLLGFLGGAGCTDQLWGQLSSQLIIHLHWCRHWEHTELHILYPCRPWWHGTETHRHIQCSARQGKNVVSPWSGDFLIHRCCLINHRIMFIIKEKCTLTLCPSQACFLRVLQLKSTSVDSAPTSLLLLHTTVFIGTVLSEIFTVDLETFEVKLHVTCHRHAISDVAFPQ